ncbi:hypothetical protein [Sphingomonas hengshuiensis]|uniref:Tip attachment protein J domain-containing protein n=1 Tax=Sphingomonas hengshuiensis TaxID=1609977 RepID=A0A7U4JA25_9SPHN|nr:hypothetical protein [Sphingomonas hengshuiensis]AJP72922.1 hypothetical protein TS85_15680 [Sphingomonas hengshuiensis]
MAKALKTVGLVVAGAALIATGVGAAIAIGTAGVGLAGAATMVTGFLGVSASTLFLASTALIAAGSLLEKSPQVPASQTDRLTASIDPRAYRKSVMGSTAMPVDIRYEEWFGTDQERCAWIVALASHRITSVDAIWFNDELAWTATGGTQGKYAGYFWVRQIVTEGAPGTIVSVSPAGTWNSAHRLTGCAYAHLEFKVTGNSKKAESPFSSGLPSRVTIVGKGSPLYDPRRDSTVPGGSGPMRADDQSTWRYVTDDGAEIGENLPLQILRELLGWRMQNPVTGQWKLAVGSGLPVRKIDLPSFLVAANLADEAVARSAGGTEPRFRGAGVLSEGDNPRTRLDMMCAGCCARLTDDGGKIGIAIAHNDLASAATDDGLNDDDVVGAFTWDPYPAPDQVPNTVRGKYVDPSDASLYQLIDYPTPAIASVDGIDRPLPFDLGFVESPSQAYRCASQTLQRKQFGGLFSAPFDMTAWKYRVGDVVPFTFAPLSFVRKLFRVVEIDPRSNPCQVVLREESALIYQWDSGDVATVQAAPPTVYDNRNNPLIRAIGDIDDAIELVASDGVLSRGEKPQVIIAYQALLAERMALDARYVALGSPSDITPARGVAATKVAALTAYLATLDPAWDDTEHHSGIDPAAYRTAWVDANGAIADYRAAITGRPGRDGLDGTNGLPGPPGADGVSPYFHVAYSNAADGSVDFTIGGAGSRTYIGVLVDNVVADSTIPGDYTWSLIKGADGANGTPGANGYVHFAYSNAADGSADFHLSDPVGRGYIGVYSDNILADSTNPADYSWSLIRGSDGLDGTDGLPGPPGADGVSQYFHVAYANAADGSVDFTIGAPGGRTHIGVLVDNVVADSTTPGDYTWSLIKGADGANGIPGADGFVHFAYSNAVDGSVGFHLSDPTGRTYIGVYSDNTLADSTNPADYSWSLIKGADAIVAALTTSVVSVSADSAGVTKAGALPRLVGLSVTQGPATVTGSASVTLTPSSDAITASYASGAITISVADTEGFVDVLVSVGGADLAPLRIQIVRPRDATPPATSSALSTDYDAFVTGSSYGSSPDTPVLTVAASASGEIRALLFGEYYVEATSGPRSFRPAAKAAFRSAGSGGAWSDLGTEALGPTATGLFSSPGYGSISLDRTATGLTAGAAYEVGFLLRKYAGTSTGETIAGTITVRQP